MVKACNTGDGVNKLFSYNSMWSDKACNTGDGVNKLFLYNSMWSDRACITGDGVNKLFSIQQYVVRQSMYHW